MAVAVEAVCLKTRKVIEAGPIVTWSSVGKPSAGFDSSSRAGTSRSCCRDPPESPPSRRSRFARGVATRERRRSRRWRPHRVRTGSRRGEGDFAVSPDEPVDRLPAAGGGDVARRSSSALSAEGVAEAVNGPHEARTLERCPRSPTGPRREGSRACPPKRMCRARGGRGSRSWKGPWDGSPGAAPETERPWVRGERPCRGRRAAASRSRARTPRIEPASALPEKNRKFPVFLQRLLPARNPS